MLTLLNPHAVLAALRERPHDVQEIRLAPGKPNGVWQEVVDQGKAIGIPVRTLLPAANTRSDEKFQRQGASSALVMERREATLDDLWPETLTPDDNARWLALDCLQDPHNVGAIFRTAAFFGIRGILITRDRSAPLTATVYDVASGGVEYVPFCQPPNLARAIELAKKRGLWVIGASEHATQPVSKVDRSRPWLIVVGNEEQGLRRLTLDLCDDRCAIPGTGSVTSLNVSVATGILLSALAPAIPAANSSSATSD